MLAKSELTVDVEMTRPASTSPLDCGDRGPLFASGTIVIQDRARFPIGERLRLGQQRKMLWKSNGALFGSAQGDLPRTDPRNRNHLSGHPIHVPAPPTS